VRLTLSRVHGGVWCLVPGAARLDCRAHSIRTARGRSGRRSRAVVSGVRSFRSAHSTSNWPRRRGRRIKNTSTSSRWRSHSRSKTRRVCNIPCYTCLAVRRPRWRRAPRNHGRAATSRASPAPRRAPRRSLLPPVESRGVRPRPRPLAASDSLRRKKRAARKSSRTPSFPR
jgi:hypothetical protein